MRKDVEKLVVPGGKVKCCSRKTMGSFYKSIPHHAAPLLPGTYTSKHTSKDSTVTFTATSLMRAQKWKQSKFLPTGEWKRKGLSMVLKYNFRFLLYLNGISHLFLHKFKLALLRVQARP